MNNIAVFGDSTADPNPKFNHSWIEILSRKFKITNYAQAGSSLLFSYEQLLIHGHKYSKIIFFVAPVGRLYVPNCELTQHFVNQNTANLFKPVNDFKQKNIIDAVEKYFNYLWVWEKEILIQRSIVDSIQKNFPQALLIPVTKDSIYNFQGLCMHDISVIDYNYHDVNYYTPDFGRTCHMNKENNLIFSQIIEKWITDKSFHIDIDQFKYPVETKEDLFYEKYQS